MKKIVYFVIVIFLVTFPLLANNIAFSAIDGPNDDGTAIQLKWEYHLPEVSYIIIERSRDHENFVEIARLSPDENFYEDENGISAGLKYYYKISLFDKDGEQIAVVSTNAKAKGQWFNTNKTSLLIMLLIIAFAILYFIFHARKGKKLYIRRIAGLDMIDEAVGRATEMGKPILFVPGIMDLDNIQTLAGLNILGHLSQKVARYDSTIHVPVSRSMVFSTAREIVKEAYLKVGRPDAFDPNSVYYLTDDQFGYVAGVDGIIMREKPAATFYLGAFYAESLILAETGHESGAIQIAGTAMPAQIPFFVAACDYTLIGEELFAASAYLSQDPPQLGCLKGQDFGKAVIMITIFVGIILELFGFHFLKDFLSIK